MKTFAFYRCRCEKILKEDSDASLAIEQEQIHEKKANNLEDSNKTTITPKLTLDVCQYPQHHPNPGPTDLRHEL